MKAERLELLFSANATKQPEAVAILWRGSETTYRELDRRSAQIARYLAKHGLGRGDCIAIGMDRSPDLVAAMLGVLRSGAAYVPVDLEMPPERIAFILEDCAAGAIIVDSAASAPSGYTGRVVAFDELAFDGLDELPMQTDLAATDLAYVIYTSGSTGRPKGVMLAHTACAYIGSSIRHFDNGELNRVAAVTSVSFDPSIFEIFGTLAAGGTIVLKANALEPFTEGEDPTLLQGVPSALRQLARAGAIPDSVRVIHSGGEALTAEVANEIYANTQVERLYNHYGPTEATICTTVALMERGSDRRPHVGKTIAGASILIRREDGSPADCGEAGEVLIGGNVLALGYLNDPQRTRERFVSDARTGQRLYRTGDIGRLLPGGELEILGRQDDQVKLRGFRIELAEIDDALIRIPGVREGAAVIAPRGDGTNWLLAFLVGGGQDACDNGAAVLRARLPGYMVPAAFHSIGALPRMPSGKVDRSALAVLAVRKNAPPLPVDEPDAQTLVELVQSQFAAALGRSEFGIDEDFFGAGGDSLQAISLALALEDAAGFRVTPDLLPHHPTPRRLAAVLELTSSSAELLTEKGTRDGAPIFFAPGIRGGDSDYSTLVRHLSDHRLLSLHSVPIMADLERKPAIETISNRLLPSIMEAQPTGTITLVGYSFGGLMAFDVARRVKEAGREVQLVLIDPQIPRIRASFQEWRNWVGDEVVAGVRRQGANDGLRRLLRSVTFWFPRSVGRLVPFRLPAFLAGHNVNFIRNLMMAQSHYDYTPVDVRTLFIYATIARDDDKFLNPDGLGGWRGLLARDARIVNFDTRHGDLIYEPVVSDVAQLIRDWCEEGEELPLRQKALAG